VVRYQAAWWFLAWLTSSTLTMVPIHFSKMPVNFYYTTWHYIPEDSTSHVATMGPSNLTIFPNFTVIQTEKPKKIVLHYNI
jgi:hypothetical protein